MEESPYLTGREHLIAKYGYLSFFGSRDEKYLASLLSISKLQRYDAGELLTVEGEYDAWIYIILSGEVRVCKQGEEIARLSRPGETVGELGLIDHAPRSATVEALDETLCLAIDGDKIEEMEEAQRDAFLAVFYRILAETLAGRLRATSAELAQTRRELDQCRGR